MPRDTKMRVGDTKLRVAVLLASCWIDGSRARPSVPRGVKLPAPSLAAAPIVLSPEAEVFSALVTRSDER